MLFLIKKTSNQCMMLTQSQTVLPGLPTLVKALVKSASLQFSLYKVVRFLFPKWILLSWFKILISALLENIYVPRQVVVVEFKYTYTLVKLDRSKTQRPQLPCQPQPTWAIDLFQKMPSKPLQGHNVSFQASPSLFHLKLTLLFMLKTSALDYTQGRDLKSPCYPSTRNCIGSINFQLTKIKGSWSSQDIIPYT